MFGFQHKADVLYFVHFVFLFELFHVIISVCVGGGKM